MTELFIGLMSGTSADGIDAALVDFSQPYPKLLASSYTPFTTALRQEILNLCISGPDEIKRLAQLDVALGHAFAQASSQLLEKSGVKATQIRAIGSHGQTVRHYPAEHFTLQIGDPNIIAAVTNITTVADFRRRDMAYGGQGAPLVPAFHRAILADSKMDRAIVNIGGIANVTLLSKNPQSPTIGFDTGPGNTLLDSWAMRALGKPYDTQGQWAASGKVIPELLKSLLQSPYFHLSPPKSTGREYFNLDWLQSYIKATYQPQDIQATLAELTAESIIQAIKNHFTSGEILLCGGGVHNTHLCDRIKALTTSFSVATTEKYGVDPDWLEAMAFAWLAQQTLAHKPGNIKEVTGAHRETILGGVYYT